MGWSRSATWCALVWFGAAKASGAEAPRDEFRDAVLVGSERGFNCSGVLVDNRHVLTAAHCLPATRIAVGESLQAGLEIAVVSGHAHPAADVAVLTLSREVAVATHARRSRRDDRAPLGVIRVVGFGVRDQSELTGFGTKHQLELPIDGWGCDLRRSADLGCTPTVELFLRGGRNNDTCYGDSGGPVFEQVAAGWQLVAITSRGARPKRIVCGEGGIYTRLDAIGSWLEEELR